MKTVIFCVIFCMGTFFGVLQASERFQKILVLELRESPAALLSHKGLYWINTTPLCDSTAPGTLTQPQDQNLLKTLARPKVVAKFGQPQCPWSEQLKQEVWNSSTFQALLEGAGIEREEKEISEKDETVPVLVLFTTSGEEIGSIGYLLISPEKYVDLLKEMLTIHTLCQSLTPLNTQQLLQLYRKSQVLHMTSCTEKLLQEGLTKDTGVEFLIEYYAKVVKEHPRKAQKIKQEIRSRKANDSATEWELALLCFQARREKIKDASKVVLPLEKFLRDYGSKDQGYAWRCHLVLAEFYRDKNLLDKARHHAKLAAEGAPSELKGMIMTIGDEPA